MIRRTAADISLTVSTSGATPTNPGSAASDISCAIICSMKSDDGTRQALSLRESRRTGSGSRFLPAFLDRDFAIVDPLLVSPFVAKTFLSCPYRTGMRGSGVAFTGQWLSAGTPRQDCCDHKSADPAEFICVSLMHGVFHISCRLDRDSLSGGNLPEERSLDLPAQALDEIRKIAIVGRKPRQLIAIG